MRYLGLGEIFLSRTQDLKMVKEKFDKIERKKEKKIKKKKEK